MENLEPRGAKMRLNLNLAVCGDPNQLLEPRIVQHTDHSEVLIIPRSWDAITLYCAIFPVVPLI